MQTTNRKIGEIFSAGDFKSAYDHFHDDITWKITGDKTTTGKNNVIGICDKLLSEMDSSTLHNTNIIEDDNRIAIEGFCKFIDSENKAMQVDYCDVYDFEDSKIKSITSYCISLPTK